MENMSHLPYKKAGVSSPQIQGWQSPNSFGCLLGRSQLERTLPHYHETELGNNILLCSQLNILNYEAHTASRVSLLQGNPSLFVKQYLQRAHDSNNDSTLCVCVL